MNMRYHLALHIAAIIFGSQHVVTKVILQDLPYPIFLNVIRFSLSLIFCVTSLFINYMCAILDNENENEELIPNSRNHDIFYKGLELGIYTFGGFFLQTIGLKYTTASRSAYLLYLNVKFVPIFNYIIYRKVYSKNTWLSVFFAMSGTLVLALDEASSGGPLNLGDILSMMSAIVSSLYIIRAETHFSKYLLMKLNTYTLLSTSIYFIIVYSLQRNEIPEFHNFDSKITCLLLYLSFVVTFLGQYLQFYGQTYISSEKSALIFALDPVYNVIFSFIVLNEHFTKQGVTGIVMILIGVLITFK